VAKEIVYLYCWAFEVRLEKIDNAIRVIYRYDPIPNTGGYKGYKRNTRWCRHVNTQQERKWYFAYPEFVRTKRNFKKLPSRWNDLKNSKMSTRSWKRTKKEKQWM
jgi:hypothetical protein